MGEEEENLAIQDEYYDQMQDRDLQAPVTPNLIHLTISSTALEFFEKHDELKDLKPLVDQIVATNHFDWNEREYYKYLVDDVILTMLMKGYGDTIEESKIIDIARTYLHQLIDGCKGGYRGRLATEIRRTYSRSETGQSQQPKRRWPF